MQQDFGIQSGCAQCCSTHVLSMVFRLSCFKRAFQSGGHVLLNFVIKRQTACAGLNWAFMNFYMTADSCTFTIKKGLLWCIFNTWAWADLPTFIFVHDCSLGLPRHYWSTVLDVVADPILNTKKVGDPWFTLYVFWFTTCFSWHSWLKQCHNKYMILK